ncbi:MAG: CBS domain-containing protein, partial [Mesorhizobium sp.]
MVITSASDRDMTNVELARIGDVVRSWPVFEDFDHDRLVGMITDRDIAIRGVALGKGPDTKVRDVMSPEVKYCFDDEDVEHVLENMGDLQVRRLPVLNRDKRLVGIISLGDLSTNGEAAEAGESLSDISKPGGEHSQ